MCVISESVTMFLHTLLARDGECTNPSERVRQLATSFGSDLVYAVTYGKTKPPKHILLPFAVKSLTGNTELIQILNRLGHSLSCSQIEEVDTVLCLPKLERSVDDVPGDICPFVFTNLAWDNIDRLEEPVSREGSSHRVNDVAVQTKIVGPMQEQVKHAVIKSKMRSIGPVALEPPTYNVGQRVGPPNVRSLNADTTKEIQDAKTTNLIWFLARISYP